ncbi:MAG: hypothetical protein HPY76_00965 [Anaerolineae bacterium]|nr:hypothetical protein [Anaerolineae bacterium]
MNTLLTSRKFWFTALALLVVVMQAFIPTFEIDQENAAALLVVIVSYLVGVSVDPGPGGWRGVLRSRKFWSAVVGLLIILLDGFGLALPFELTAEQLIALAVTIGGYITAVALEKPKGLPQPAR